MLEAAREVTAILAFMDRVRFPSLCHPIVQAPLAGGPATPSLAAAVSAVGALGSWPRGTRQPIGFGRRLTRLGARCRTVSRSGSTSSHLPVTAARSPSCRSTQRRCAPTPGVSVYLATLAGTVTDTPRSWPCWLSCAYLSCPSRSGVRRPATSPSCRSCGSAVWMTFTSVPEARVAADVGADALVVQGVEAGGHRGGSTTAHRVTSGCCRCFSLSTLRSLVRFPSWPREASPPAAP